MRRARLDAFVTSLALNVILVGLLLAGYGAGA